MARERRNWTSAEDALLKKAVSDASLPVNWHSIAADIPGRTNKDCRKRWHYKVAACVTKGVWTAQEDEQLRKAVKKYGTKWSQVASEITTRNGDQCSKRWNDVINPEINRSAWNASEDELLLQSVERYGRNWKTIIDAYFPGRTALSGKNRYSLLIKKMDGSRNPRTGKKHSTRMSSLSNSLGRSNAKASSHSLSVEKSDSDPDSDDLDESDGNASSDEEMEGVVETRKEPSQTPVDSSSGSSAMSTSNDSCRAPSFENITHDGTTGSESFMGTLAPNDYIHFPISHQGQSLPSEGIQYGSSDPMGFSGFGTGGFHYSSALPSTTQLPAHFNISPLSYKGQLSSPDAMHNSKIIEHISSSQAEDMASSSISPIGHDTTYCSGIGAPGGDAHSTFSLPSPLDSGNGVNSIQALPRLSCSSSGLGNQSPMALDMPTPNLGDEIKSAGKRCVTFTTLCTKDQAGRLIQSMLEATNTVFGDGDGSLQVNVK